MDFATLVIFLVSFVACLALVALFSVFGTKEQTYEDGLRLSREKSLSDTTAKKRLRQRKKSPDTKVRRKSPDSKVPKKGVTAPSQRANATTEAIDTTPKAAFPTPDPVEQAKKPVAEEEPPTVEDSVSRAESMGLTLTAAGRVKNKAKKRMTVEEVEFSNSTTKQTITPLSQVAVVEAPPVAKQGLAVSNCDGGGKEAAPVSPLLAAPRKPRKGASSSSPLQQLQDAGSVPQPMKQPKHQVKVQAQDLLSAVKKTTFEVDELQNLIDILLNKQQQGGGSGGGGWVERGGQVSEMKLLEKALSERKCQLEEESAKVKSVTERYHQVRQELNLKTQQLSAAQRDFQSRQQAQAQGFEVRLQQEGELRHREVSHLQQQIQYQLRARLQDDGQVKTELEQSKKACVGLEHELAAVRGQVASLQAELAQEKDRGRTKDEEAARGWELKCSEAAVEAKRALEVQLNDANQKVARGEKQISSLSEENERLSEQLASAVERPMADGQESACNGDMGSSNKQKEDEQQQFRLRCKQLEDERSAAMKEIASVAKMESEKSHLVEQLTKELASIKTELELQRVKNDEAKAVGKREREEVETSQKKFLARLFPELQLQSGDGETEVAFTVWMEGFATKVDAFKFEMKGKGAEPADTGELNDLRGQVQKYKSVLNETETVLHRLQSNVEEVESGWKEKVAGKQREIDSLAQKNEELARSNAAAHESLNVVNSAEEMQEKLEELQGKLAEEEEARARLAESSELRLAEKEALEKELESERKVKAELGLQVARLNQVIATSQEALQQEQKTVDLLRELVPKENVAGETPEGQGEDLSANDDGQEPPAVGQAKTPTASVSSVGSLDFDNTPNKDKKSAKKKLLGLIKKGK